MFWRIAKHFTVPADALAHGLHQLFLAMCRDCYRQPSGGRSIGANCHRPMIKIRVGLRMTRLKGTPPRQTWRLAVTIM